jgi:25S rRNA (cytosine2870-C5)-methyltransferase
MGKPMKGKSGAGKTNPMKPDAKKAQGKKGKKAPEPEPESESEESAEESPDLQEDSESESEEVEESSDADAFPVAVDREDEDGSVEGSEQESGSEDGSGSAEEGSDDEDEEEIGNDNEDSGDRMDNPLSVRERIDGALKILSDFKNRNDKSRSRVDIIEDLGQDLSEYYGYTEELAGFLLQLFSPQECVEYMDASDRPRPVVIRTNTLKVTRKELMEALDKRGANVEAIEWSKVAIKVIEAAVPIGATPEYLAGHYMLQSAASLNPVMALAPRPTERILDMSAAPGGKTTYIAQLMKNSGTLVANDLKASRQKSTIANLHRMGVKTSIVSCYDGRKVPGIMKGFDRALLDAPCSGLGVISRDQTVKIQRTVKDIQRISHVQKELLCAAIDCVDHKSTAGIIVYSTCSISCEENEQVVQYALRKRHVKLVETGLEVGRPGFTRYQERRFHPSMNLTRRFYPHVHNMDGFYVAKFRKLDAGERHSLDDDESDDEDAKGKGKGKGKEKEKENAKKKKFQDSEDEEESDDDDDDEGLEAMDTVGDTMEDLGPSKSRSNSKGDSDSDDSENEDDDEDDDDEEPSMYVEEDEDSEDASDSEAEGSDDSDDISPLKTRRQREAAAATPKLSKKEQEKTIKAILKEPKVKKLLDQLSQMDDQMEDSDDDDNNEKGESSGSDLEEDIGSDSNDNDIDRDSDSDSNSDDQEKEEEQESSSEEEAPPPRKRKLASKSKDQSSAKRAKEEVKKSKTSSKAAAISPAPSRTPVSKSVTKSASASANKSNKKSKSKR